MEDALRETIGTGARDTGRSLAKNEIGDADSQLLKELFWYQCKDISFFGRMRRDSEPWKWSKNAHIYILGSVVHLYLGADLFETRQETRPPHCGR